MKEKLSLKRRDQLLIGVGLVLLVLIVGAIALFSSAISPMLSAQKNAEKIALDFAKVKDVDKFYSFTRKNTYYTVEGKNEEGKEVFVVIPQNGGTITVTPVSDGIKEGQATATVLDRHSELSKITGVNLGLFDEQLVWEVVGQTKDGKFEYFLLNFKDGSEMKG